MIFSQDGVSVTLVNTLKIKKYWDEYEYGI